MELVVRKEINKHTMSYHFEVGDWIGDARWVYVPKCVQCKSEPAHYTDTDLCISCDKYQAQPSECRTCNTKFPSRGALFRHLRVNADHVQ